MRKSRNSARTFSLLLVAVFGTSCVVPPSCLDLAFGSSPPKSEPIVVLTVYSEPIKKPLQRRYPAGVGMWERFERGSAMIVNTKGRMQVSSPKMWPETCPTVSQEDLVELSQYWQPILAPMNRPLTRVMVMANPYTWKDDWTPDGPYVGLTYGTVSGKSVSLMWDGESDLPEELDTAVMGTLEMICSHSRLAKTYLFRDLPQQTTSRLKCE